VAEGVVYSVALIRKLEECLRSAFRQPYMQLTKPTSGSSPGDIRITLSPGQGNQRIAAADGKSPAQIVMEILTEGGRRSTFWFGFVAVFKLAESHKHSLQHASILVFHDIAGELVSLFRAEWDQLDALNLGSKHVQPHWHFTQSPARIESVLGILSASDTTTITEFSPEPQNEFFANLADCTKIHFAMTSLWEEGETTSFTKSQFNSDQFPKWFKNLSAHIAEQISYVVSHMPVSENFAVRDFTPEN
jgi:hypothetical protein